MHPGQHPLLFQLLNEMDGLAEDADVVFVLTTNRADLLEPALAARPGRVDQAVELDLPGRRGPPARCSSSTAATLQVDPAGLDDVIARDRGGHRVVPQGAAAPGRPARGDGRRPDAAGGGGRGAEPWSSRPRTWTRPSTSCSTPATP